MVIDGASDQTKATAFQLVDRSRAVALLKQQVAGSKYTDSAPGLKGSRQGIRRHRAVSR